MKNQYIGELSQKCGLGHVTDLGGGRGGGGGRDCGGWEDLEKRKGGGVFEGGLIPQCTLCKSGEITRL